MVVLMFWKAALLEFMFIWNLDWCRQTGRRFAVFPGTGIQNLPSGPKDEPARTQENNQMQNLDSAAQSNRSQVDGLKVID